MAAAVIIISNMITLSSVITSQQQQADTKSKILAMYIIQYTSITSSTIVAATIDMTVKLGNTPPKSTIMKIDQMKIFPGAGIFGGQLRDILIIIQQKHRHRQQ
jgi:hypothetical protein